MSLGGYFVLLVEVRLLAGGIPPAAQRLTVDWDKCSREMVDRTEFSLQSVRRALAIIEIAAQNKVVSIRSVADQLGLSKSTANRLVSELRNLGFLEPANEQVSKKITNGKEVNANV